MTSDRALVDIAMNTAIHIVYREFSTGLHHPPSVVTRIA